METLDGADATRRPATIVGLISASTESGRTGAITNLGWILASAGKRVLIVDWGTEHPNVHDYLRPFQVADSPAEDVLGYSPDLSFDSQPPAALRQYAVPAGVCQVHVLGGRPERFAGGDGAGGRSDPSTAARVAKWRTWLRQLNYDYVLIDGPTDASADGLARMAGLCDSIGVLFVPRRASVEAAADLAFGIVAAGAQAPRVLPVPTQVDDRGDERAQRSRAFIDETFTGGRFAGRALRVAVEIPYRPYHEYDEALAVLLDEPKRPGTLLAAYERLADVITDGEVTALVPPPVSTRDRYRHRLSLAAPAQVWQIALAYAAPDRPWADWARHRLERGGAEVIMVSADGEWPADTTVPSLVVISSPHLAHSPVVSQLARITQTGTAGAPVDVIGMRVPDPDTGRQYLAGGPAAQIVVGDRTELEVGGELLARFGLFDELGDEALETIRFPGGAGPDLSNLPPRNRDFVGRDAELENLRDLIIAAPGSGRCVIGGPPGAGTSELAREYAHRFGYCYDLIWWIPAHDQVAARATLRRLAELKVRSDTGDAMRAALDALSSGEWFPRSLLIYDNVTDLAGMANLLPADGAVDVLVTGHDAHAEDGWGSIPVAELDPPHSNTLLRDQITGLSIADAERVSASLGQMPLALRLAVGWLRARVAKLRAGAATVEQSAAQAARDFLDKLGELERSDSALAEPPPALTRVLRIVLAGLGELPDGPLTIRVAQFCAFLSPEGVALELLRSAAVVDRLTVRTDPSGAAMRLDTGELDRVLWTGARYGLFEVRWGDPASVVLSRQLQALLRTGAVADDRDRVTQEDVLAGLAAYAPSETAPWSGDAIAKFDELRKHLVSSGALQSDDDAVRRWIVRHGRFIQSTGDGAVWRYSVRVAERLADRWRSVFGDQDQLLLRLEGGIASLNRALGNFEQARRIGERVLATQRRTLGNRNLQTLITARGRGADLRSIGAYQDAYAEDSEVWRGFREILGDDHTYTRMAAHNRAISAYLMGEVRQAVDIQRDHRKRQARLFGPQHPATWSSAASVGVYVRELGRFADAKKILTDASYEMKRHRPARHPDVLWIDWQLAVARRRTGGALQAKQSNTMTARIYGELYGEDHPNTRGCTLSLAADHHADGESARAMELATRCLDSYVRRLGADHPFTAVCRMNLALYTRAVGFWDDALRDGDLALSVLRERLGDTHPWTLNATINQASTLAGRGEVAAAIELAEPNDSDCRDLLGAWHPYTLASGKNLVLMREARDSIGASGDLRWSEMDIDVLPN